MKYEGSGDGKQRTLSFYERGPGPAGYGLPPLVGKKNHALTHRINPEYSIAKKLRSTFLAYSLGPGPKYQIPHGMKANGKFIGFQYTMRPKFPILEKFIVPAPNLYHVPNTDVFRPKAPKHKFGSRTPLLNKKVSPGPVYMLPQMIGPRIPDRIAAAECTMKGNRKFHYSSLAPGPGYDVVPVDVVKPKSPSYTMRIKWKEFEDQTLAGPGSYEVKIPKCPCKNRKGWHLGVKHNEFTGIMFTPCDKSSYQPLDIY